MLAPLGARAAEGTPTRQLADELYAGWAHSWALGEARRQAARLPAHADRDELTSQVLRLAWEACLRIDWARLDSWPAFLEAKVASAGAEAARSDDWLGRRQRAYRRRYRRTVAELEQARGRAASAAERLAVAGASAPASRRVDWAQELVTARHPALVAEVPDVATSDDVAEAVEEELMRAERAARVDEWLGAIRGEDSGLAGDLRRWCDAQAGGERAPAFPARLARRALPYAPLLAGLLAEA